jgi:hypothetical protein
MSDKYQVTETDAYVELVIPFDDELDFKVYNPSFLAQWTGWEDVDVVLEKNSARQRGGGFWFSQPQPQPQQQQLGSQPQHGSQEQKEEELSFPYRYFDQLMHPGRWLFPQSRWPAASTKSPLVQWPKSLSLSQLFSKKDPKEKEPTQVSISISSVAKDAWNTTKRDVSQTMASATKSLNSLRLTNQVNDSSNDVVDDSSPDVVNDSSPDVVNDSPYDSQDSVVEEDQEEEEEEDQEEEEEDQEEGDKTPPRRLHSVDDGARIVNTAVATARQITQQWRIRVNKTTNNIFAGRGDTMVIQTHWFRTLLRLQDLERKAGCRIVAGEFVDVLGTPLYIGDIRPLADDLPQPCEAMVTFLQLPTTQVLPHTFMQRYRDYFLKTIDA